MTALAWAIAKECDAPPALVALPPSKHSPEKFSRSRPPIRRRPLLGTDGFLFWAVEGLLNAAMALRLAEARPPDSSPFPTVGSSHLHF